jgi:hypothetical protein
MHPARWLVVAVRVLTLFAVRRPEEKALTCTSGQMRYERDNQAHMKRHNSNMYARVFVVVSLFFHAINSSELSLQRRQNLHPQREAAHRSQCHPLTFTIALASAPPATLTLIIMEYHPLATQAQQQASASDSPSSSGSVAPAPSSFWHVHPPLPDRRAQHRMRLTAEQLAAYDRDGYLLIKAKDVWTAAELKLMVASVNLMNDWPDRAGAYMKVRTDNTETNGNKATHHRAQMITCS